MSLVPSDRPAPASDSREPEAPAADFDRVPSAEDEALLARRHSAPTRVLGWMLIAVFPVELVSPIAHETLLIYGLVFLLAGVTVLRGSQSAIRFTIFLTVLFAIPILTLLLPEILRLHPVEIRGQWRDYRDTEFWTLGVSPLMLLVAGFVLAVATLRSRRILFWTRPVRCTAGILAALLFAKFGTVAWEWNRKRCLARDMAGELRAAREAFSELGRTTVPDPAWSEHLAAFPRVGTVLWQPSAAGSYPLHDPYNPLFYPSGGVGVSPEGRREWYSEWMRDSSGKWGKFQVSLIVPDS